ncbi:AAA family ATPase [Pyrodictium abyssi]|uniref:AAA family ATPase n=1 Tax=Pyrodictium abyssi TaxID=54256 RepID=UPI0030C69ED6
MAGDAPSIGQLLSICGGEEYKGTMLCRLINAYAAGDRGAAVSLARDLFGLVRELSGAGRGGGPRILVSVGPSRHWRDSFMYAARHGLVPWACGFTLEDSVLESSRSGGPHYRALLDALARGFLERDGVFEAVPPIILYYSSGVSVIGFGLVVWADVSPLRARLWSEERCPPSGKGTCYTVRWYTLPIALGCRAVGERGVVEPGRECALGGIEAGYARNCAQSVSRDVYPRLVEALLRAVDGGAGAERVGYAVELVSSALGEAGPPRPSRLDAYLGAGPSGVVAERGWREVLEDPGTVERIVREIHGRGVFLPEQLVRVIVFLVANGNVLLAGPPGYGKTLLARVIAGVTGSELVPATCHAGWTRSEFIGGPYLRRGGVAWRSGYLVRAVARALQGRRVLLLLDEVNRAEVDKVFGEFFTVFPSPSAEEWSIGSLCDIVCGESSEEERDEPARILCSACGDRERLQRVRDLLRIVATMNTVDYATVFGVGEAFGRRFYKVEFLASSDAGYILESEVRPVFRHVVKRLGLASDRLRGLEEVLEKLARFVAELRRARDEAGVAGIVVTQLPVGPAFVREVVTVAARMLAAGVVGDPVCAVARAIGASIPVTVLVEEESRERLRRALAGAFGDAVEEKCRLVAGRP